MPLHARRSSLCFRFVSACSWLVASVFRAPVRVCHTSPNLPVYSHRPIRRPPICRTSRNPSDLPSPTTTASRVTAQPEHMARIATRS
ncbi:hypothetical protein GGS23DRAFT_562950 [Durotheca rogersii]|uniref:uncharacterized protein n=1 Tax=Durotheca rogersii TaxID=419775 RepID=UPI002220BF57|nr:uncharacterized protein GGS23DRAFT_562950 [Durotheca rogersii]KAI5864098.1 hypothetical protein GGS23DRAFT_562950 [Durotheca rogersii]